MKEKVRGVWLKEGKRKELFTLSSGKEVFEAVDHFRTGGKEYRRLDPERSKFGAAVMKGLQQSGFQEGSVVLYLGASHGYTPSFVSDIVGKGFVFALDFAPRVVRDLVFVCEQRKNMAPLLANAAHPETYSTVGEVDIVYQDIAQRDQLKIFKKNCDMFLKKGGVGMLAVKARSIDVTKKPKDIFRSLRKEMETGDEFKEYVIVDYRELDPFEKDHAFFVLKRK